MTVIARPDNVTLVPGAMQNWSDLEHRPAGLVVGREVQGPPVDRDLAAADAEKAAEIDDGGANAPVPIHHDVDDAAHILAGRATHLAAEHALGVVRADDGDCRRLGLGRLGDRLRPQAHLRDAGDHESGERSTETNPHRASGLEAREPRGRECRPQRASTIDT